MTIGKHAVANAMSSTLPNTLKKHVFQTVATTYYGPLAVL